MMPYIKQEKRNFYDMMIMSIVAKFEPAIVEITEQDKNQWIADFQLHILAEPEDQQDGQFNYFLTKLLKSLHWLSEGTSYFAYKTSEPKILMVIVKMLEIYRQPTPSYFRYNRAMGMLLCCMKEMKRRYSTRAVLPMLFLEQVIKILYEEIGAYEVKKIEENGDV